MFMLLLSLLLGVALLHGFKTQPRTPERVTELVLIYLLAGYCGILMLAVGVFVLVGGEHAAAMLSAAAGNLFQQFFGFAYVGMALIAVLSIWLRGPYLIAPVLCWSVYFFGATYVHIADFSAAGTLTFGTLLQIFVTHALVPLLMLGLITSSHIFALRSRTTPKGLLRHSSLS